MYYTTAISNAHNQTLWHSSHLNSFNLGVLSNILYYCLIQIHIKFKTQSECWEPNLMPSISSNECRQVCWLVMQVNKELTVWISCNNWATMSNSSHTLHCMLGHGMSERCVRSGCLCDSKLEWQTGQLNLKININKVLTAKHFPLTLGGQLILLSVHVTWRDSDLSCSIIVHVF